MLHLTQNWKRFWYPRETKISLADGGYLADPDSTYRHYLSLGIVSFNSIVDNPCLVLLGEPGIGKSTAIVQASQQVDKTGEVWLKFDLGEYQSDTRLCDKVFGNQTFQAWLKGTHRLHLFLDSLDEGRLAINNLAKILASELKNYPCDRLLLRITCRTAEWSNPLEEKLRQLWGKEAVEVYNMAPLRRVDVSEAAKAKNLDPDAFLDEISDKEVVPLAIKPVTLDFLLDTYKKNGQFPSTQKELYFQGCQSLCEEPNEEHRDAKLTGDLTGDQRMIVAARIASVTVFANRSAIWTGIKKDLSDDADITVRDFCSSIEKAIGIEFPVNENEVKKALGTGLFSSHSSYRMRWAHQTYAEFLAAWYLVQHKIPLVQIMSLIVSPEDPEHKLVPQLHETAAWLAGMMPDVFRQILKTDPDVLLRSDVATADVKDREALVENLLKLYDEEKLPNGALGNYNRYRKLEHPGLVEQLRPYIRDLNKGFEARYVAIDIAEACVLQALQDDLADVALDTSQALRIRLNAVSAICKIGNEEVKARLKPLAIGEAKDNSEVDLKHYALQAVWPDHITAEELFSALTPSNSIPQKLIFGDFVQHLQPVDLPTALEWVNKQNPLHQSFEKLVDAIMLKAWAHLVLKAWEHLESPGMLKALAKVALSQLRHHDDIMASCHDSLFGSVLSNGRQEWQNRYQNQNQPLLYPPPAERIIALLDDFESGNLTAWWDITGQMILRPDGTYDVLSERDLTVLLGWNTADTETRARLVEAAKKYVLEAELETDSLRSSTCYHSSLLGYQTLRLLLKEAPSFVSSISVDVWKKWAPFILLCSSSSGAQEEELDYHLLKMTYQHAPVEIINTLILLIDKENEEHNRIFINCNFEGCWDERLENALLTKAKDNKLKPESMGYLLKYLLDHAVDKAKAFAESIIPLQPSSLEEKQVRAFVAASVLITHAKDAGWSVVWPAIQQDSEFGRKVVEDVSYSDRYAVNVGQALSEEQLANLYVWLVHQYPYAEDPKHEGVYSPGPRDNIAKWRDAILRLLQERGTPQAFQEIQEIINKLPEVDWLKMVLLEAQILVRRRTWVSPQPSTILELVSNQQIRLVQGENQLLDVLVESLERLETKLQGETPAAIFLWDQICSGVYRPKDENTFSDFVKLHLDEDLKKRGIIINREVELRCSQGSAPGERTDIHVDAVIRGQDGQVYDSVTVIIEVKGCWNPELKDAMKNQLVDRYLRDNSCQHGLYLVGWFNCVQWDNNDYKKKRAPKISLYEARDQFKAQAAMTSQHGIQVEAMVINAALR